MPKQQKAFKKKAFNRKVVKYARSFYVNVPKEVMLLDIDKVKLNVEVQPKEKIAKVILGGGLK